jgi:hypothetical protein
LSWHWLVAEHELTITELKVRFWYQDFVPGRPFDNDTVGYQITLDVFEIDRQNNQIRVNFGGELL